jgi:hypothetical protein
MHSAETFGRAAMLVTHLLRSTPLGLALLRRDQPDRVFVQPLRGDVRFDAGDEAMFVGLG